MPKQVIHTTQAPAAIGAYSQAIRVAGTVYVSGQIPLDPATGQLVAGDIRAQIHQVFRNLAAVAGAAGLGLDSAVKVTVFLTDLGNFSSVNEVMKQYFSEPYPARSTIGVASLPLGAAVEIDMVAVLG